MAGIQTSIELQNRMTQSLMNSVSALDTVISSFGALENASSCAFNTSSLLSARTQLEYTGGQIEVIMQNTSQAETKQNKFNQSLKKCHGIVDKVHGRIMKVSEAIGDVFGVDGILGLSDEMTQTTARLNMMNDGLQTTEQLQQMIFQSAQDSRASYQTTANVVEKLGLGAKDVFNSNAETIQFAENLNKEFAIAGASQQDMESASLQLAQALGSGALRAEDLNAVFRIAPNVIETIADYLNVPIEKIGEMASNGAITSDIVKNAMLSATDNINQEFEQMPITWEQVTASLKNSALMSFQPILNKISEIANSDRFEGLSVGLSNVLSFVSTVLGGLFNVVITIGSVIYDNWSIIEPVIWGIVAALIVYNAVMGIGWLTTLKDLAVKGAHAIASGAETAAIIAMIIAQDGLNAALSMCPITWIIIVLIALIAIFYAVIARINMVRNTTISATGVICGAVMWLLSLVVNSVIGTINAVFQYVWNFVTPFIGIIEWILNVCDGGFDSFVGAVANLIGQIISWFLDLGKIVTKVIDAIFGTNWTDGLTSLQDNVLSWGKNDDAITFTREAPQIDYRMDMTDAYDRGNNFGKEVDEKIKNIGVDIPNAGENANGFDYTQFENNTNGFDYTQFENNTNGFDYTQFENNTNDISKNTLDTSEALNNSAEDLKYIREAAERAAVLRYTTNEFKIDMTNNNNINGKNDVNGIADILKISIEEQMNSVAEGAS